MKILSNNWTTIKFKCSVFKFNFLYRGFFYQNARFAITNSTIGIHCYEFAWELTPCTSYKFIWSSHTPGSLVKARRIQRLRVRARKVSVISIDGPLIIHSIDYTIRARGHWSRMNPETLTARSHPGPAIDCFPLIRSTVRQDFLIKIRGLQGWSKLHPSWDFLLKLALRA